MALFLNDYPSAVNTRELLQRINALPGKPLSMQSLWQQAYIHKIDRHAHSTKPRMTPGRNPNALAADLEPLDPVMASADTVAGWAALNGVAGRRITLRLINNRRVQLGLPPFIITRVMEAA